jgi:hypothetical protein
MKHLMRFNESLDHKIRTTIEEILLEFQDR